MMLTIRPKDKVLLLDPDAGGVVIVFVTSANLATVFTGMAFGPSLGDWLPQKLYAYEMIIGKLIRLGQPASNPCE